MVVEWKTVWGAADAVGADAPQAGERDAMSRDSCVRVTLGTPIPVDSLKLERGSFATYTARDPSWRVPQSIMEHGEQSVVCKQSK